WARTASHCVSPSPTLPCAILGLPTLLVVSIFFIGGLYGPPFARPQNRHTVAHTLVGPRDCPK
ncbi:unnamed protein product, partial [Staurois parvus]